MSINKKVIIIHGAYGNPDENWFPWLAKQVESEGHEAVRPRLPTPKGQTLNAWREEFSQQVGKVPPSAVLVGHSLGPAFILDVIERLDHPVAGTFLVSGFLGELGLADFDGINQSFVCREFDWEGIRSRAGEVHLFNSDNDPYVPFERGEELRDHLHGELHVVKGGGHINASAGFRAFDELWQHLRAIL